MSSGVETDAYTDGGIGNSIVTTERLINPWDAGAPSRRAPTRRGDADS
jgi:hypothetical protein